MDRKTVITESLNYIENNIKNKITIDEIAGNAGYTKFYFSRLFKQEMKVSVMEYVRERKMIYATREILNGNKILDVAIEYGWESHSGFIKAFKSYYGFSPSLLYAMKLEIIHFGGRDMSNCNFYKIMDEHLSKEELFKVLCEKMIEHGYDNQKSNKVYNFCQSIYGDRKRYSGDDYVTHLLNVSLLLVQMEAEESVIYAGMFCDVFRKTNVAIDELKENLPDSVVEILIRLKDYDIEKVGLEDEQCAVLKIAERLHNMRTIEYMEECERQKRAKETIAIFMPVVKKLQDDKLISELNEISINCLK